MRSEKLEKERWRVYWEGKQIKKAVWGGQKLGFIIF